MPDPSRYQLKLTFLPSPVEGANLKLDQMQLLWFLQLQVAKQLRSTNQDLVSTCSSALARTRTGALAKTNSGRLSVCCELVMTMTWSASARTSLTENSFFRFNYNTRSRQRSSLIDRRRNWRRQGRHVCEFGVPTYSQLLRSP